MTTCDRLEPSTATGHVSNEKDDDEMKNRYIAKLRDHVVEKIVHENRTTSSSSLVDDHDQLTRLVEQRIAKMFNGFHTPDHPTYAFMIRRAITELNDEGRSDKESISVFIRKEYADLPVAHESVLSFQLNKLCEKGEILLSAVGCYLLPAGDYVQQKLVMRENREERVEKKGDGGAGFVLKGGYFKGNNAVDGSHEREVCSRRMNGRKRKGIEGLRTRTRWSKRLHSDKIQIDKANNGDSEIVKDITQAGEESSTCRGQKCHIDLPIADHRMEGQHFEIIEDPFEPPGFSSKSNQLISQNEQAGTDFQAFEIGAEVEQNQEENEMKSDTSQCFDGGNISGVGERDHFKHSCYKLLQPGARPNSILEDAQNIQLQTPAPALENDSLRSNNMDADLHNGKSAEIVDAVLLPGPQGKPAADDCVLILNQTTGVELSPLREEEAAGSFQCQVIGPCTGNVPNQPVLTATLDMALKDQQTLSTEMVTTPANPSTDACPTALLNSQPDDDQHPKKQDTTMRRGRGRPRKTSNGFPIVTEKPKKKDGGERPRKEKPDELPKPTTDVEVENTSKKTADSWDREVAGTKQQNSNSVNVASLPRSPHHKTKRAPISVNESGDLPRRSTTKFLKPWTSQKQKKCRGNGIKKICYTDISITDLVYSQDHLLQPTTRLRGRPRKL